MKKNFIAILVVLSSLLTAGEKGFEFRVESLSFEEGISHNMVYSILQDKYGFMWFGTMYGLIRYDGFSYKKYKHDPADSTTLTNDDIVCILESGNGDLWLGTYGGGLNKYNRSTNTFSRYDAGFFRLEEKWDGVVWQLEEDGNGNIWIATRGVGVIKINVQTNKFSVYDFTRNINLGRTINSVYGLLFDGTEKKLWLTSSGGILNEYITGTDSFVTYNPGISGGGKEYNYLTQLISFNDSSLLLGSNRGVYLFNKGSKTFSRPIFSDEYNFNMGNVESLLQDKESRLWTGTNTGLFVTDIKKRLTKRFYRGAEQDYKIEGDNIVSLCQDSTGLIWAGSYLGGIYKIHPGESPFELEKSEKPISAFENFGGKLLIGGADGLKLYNYVEKEYVSLNFPDDKVLNTAVTKIKCDDLGNYWIGTYRGIYLYMPATNTLRKYISRANDSTTVSNNIATQFLADSKGNMWVGTINGLNKYDYSTGKFKRYLPDNSAIRGVNVLSIFEDTYGYIWVGTYRGLNRYDGSNDSFITYSQNISDKKSISNKYVFSFLEDTAGNLWLATAGGLNYFDRSEETFSFFAEKDGFASSVLFAIQRDSSGFIWVSGNRGICRFDPATKQINNYDIRDGLQSNMFNNSSLKLPNGKIVFGGIKGFNIIDPALIKKEPSRANIIFTSLNVMDKDLAETNDINKLSELKLTYNENFVAIGFALVDYINPGKNKYKYILEGIDDDWKLSGNTNLANYTNLPPGNYIFKVKAANSTGVWKTGAKELGIIIVPPFRETIWFSLILLAVSIFIVYALYRKKIASEIRKRVEIEKIRIIENEKVRKKAADDFHDELGHHITKISLYTEILKRQSDQFGKEALIYLNKIGELTKGLSVGVRDFIWTLDPGKDTLFEVAIRLKDFGDDLFDKTGILFSVEGISQDFEKIKLSVDWRRHLTMMFKEAMNNALKYAGCTSVSLSFSLSNKNIRLSLRDNGVGISAAGSSQGRGLKSIMKRASDINSKLEIIKHEPSGTEVRFEGILL
jgi:ligand-binding sensor domain-containing protein/signal transduction histidine kinase